MTPTNVDEMLFSWNDGQEKGFKLIDPDLFGVEWVVLVKRSENLYECIESRSSTKIGPFKKERMQKLLGSDKLQLYSSVWGIDFKYKKSNGCECGAWATRNPDCHAWKCPKARNF